MCVSKGRQAGREGGNSPSVRQAEVIHSLSANGQGGEKQGKRLIRTVFHLNT